MGRFTGLLTPVFTPFKNNLQRSLNLDIIPSYAKYLVDAGLKGILVNGTTGEGTSMTVEERKLVTEAWVLNCAEHKLRLVVQVGGAPLTDVLHMAQHAEKQGVNAILCLPELYNKPSTAGQLIEYLKTVSEAAPHTPLFYYHIPRFTNVNINMGVFLNEAKGKIPTLHGIKFTSTNLEEGLDAVKANDRQYSVFLGSNSTLVGGFALGFNSAIVGSTNMFPGQSIRILKHIEEGNLSQAQVVQDELNTALEVVCKTGYRVPTIKHAMNLLTSIKVGPPRLPLLPLSTTEAAEMLEGLQKRGLIHN